MSLYCIAHVPCSNSTDTIRLTKYSSNTRGRLEVCSDDRWGTVCGEGATLDTIAIVVCRELNHAADGWCIIYVNKATLLIIAGTGHVEKDISDYIFHPVPITQTNMVCTGLENAISECKSDGNTGNPDCDHYDDIFIYCSRK